MEHDRYSTGMLNKHTTKGKVSKNKSILSAALCVFFSILRLHFFRFLEFRRIERWLAQEYEIRQRIWYKWENWLKRWYDSVICFHFILFFFFFSSSLHSLSNRIFLSRRDFVYMGAEQKFYEVYFKRYCLGDFIIPFVGSVMWLCIGCCMDKDMESGERVYNIELLFVCYPLSMCCDAPMPDYIRSIVCFPMFRMTCSNCLLCRCVVQPFFLTVFSLMLLFSFRSAFECVLFLMFVLELSFFFVVAAVVWLLWIFTSCKDAVYSNRRFGRMHELKSKIKPMLTNMQCLDCSKKNWSSQICAM